MDEAAGQTMPGVPPDARQAPSVRVVLFSGGRGSGALTATLVQTPGVHLTIAINGYDDGASTGEVRRFLGDSLGPSDFRKNASRLAGHLQTCSQGLIHLLDRRLPADADASTLRSLIDALSGTTARDADVSALPADVARRVADCLVRFQQELSAGRHFDFADCAVGNLVFAGAYLLAERSFNTAVDEYASLVGLPAGLIENVTDGTNACLVALDVDGGVLAREADIVDATRRNRIRDIYLLPAALSGEEASTLASLGGDRAARALDARAVHPPLNPRLASALAAADVIVYAPGTQHSSLFPSYLTEGLGDAIARNLGAIKLLITNIQADAEIAGASAVDIIDRAVHFLKDKSRLQAPTPALVTHYLVNDPGTVAAQDETYVPLGRLDALQDPRLVRIGQYEEGVTGRHDAAKVLGPYMSEILARQHARRRVAVLLYDCESADKLAQTLLEVVRGGIAAQSVDVTMFADMGVSALDARFLDTLPFPVRDASDLGHPDRHAALLRELTEGGFEYLVLFESSGMYNGEDIPWILSHLTGRLDAVWGSRRLSVRDIQESLRLKYHKRAWLAAMSAIGSHALSLLYLLLYGRYVSDTLSGARALRVSDAVACGAPLTDRRVNQFLLSRLLGRKAEMFEVPVHFYSLSPALVRRTTAGEGLRAVGLIVRQRFVTPPPAGGDVASRDRKSAKA